MVSSYRMAASNPECSSGMGGHTYEISEECGWKCTECGHVYVSEGGVMRGVWTVSPAAAGQGGV